MRCSACPYDRRVALRHSYAIGNQSGRVADNHARAAVSALYAEFGLVTEPGGALSVAALLAEPILLQGRTSIAVVSGRNLDKEQFISMISEA